MAPPFAGSHNRPTRPPRSLKGLRSPVMTDGERLRRGRGGDKRNKRGGGRRGGIESQEPMQNESTLQSVLLNEKLRADLASKRVRRVQAEQKLKSDRAPVDAEKFRRRIRSLLRAEGAARYQRGGAKYVPNPRGAAARVLREPREVSLQGLFELEDRVLGRLAAIENRAGPMFAWGEINEKRLNAIQKRVRQRIRKYFESIRQPLPPENILSDEAIVENIVENPVTGRMPFLAQQTTQRRAAESAAAAATRPTPTEPITQGTTQPSRTLAGRILSGLAGINPFRGVRRQIDPTAIPPRYLREKPVYVRTESPVAAALRRIRRTTPVDETGERVNINPKEYRYVVAERSRGWENKGLMSFDEVKAQLAKVQWASMPESSVRQLELMVRPGIVSRWDAELLGNRKTYRRNMDASLGYGHKWLNEWLNNRLNYQNTETNRLHASALDYIDRLIAQKKA